MQAEYAIIVKNKTRLEALVERFNTQAQASFYINRQGGHIEDYVAEHDMFHESLLSVQTQLSKVIKHKVVERSFLPTYLFSEKNIIVVIGQDGLVANTAKYSAGLPIIAVNPDKQRYDGVLLPFDPTNFIHGVEHTLAETAQTRIMHFAEAKMNDGQRLIAFNDLFIGAASHVSARYRISFNGKTEEHSSSGLIVSTKAGSTGWLSSVFNMAYGVTHMFEKSVTLRQPSLRDTDLLFAVREPFQSMKTQINIAIGMLQGKNHLRIESLMPSNGVIFSDGIENDFLKFNSGSIVEIGLAPEVARLVMPEGKVAVPEVRRG